MKNSDISLWRCSILYFKYKMCFPGKFLTDMKSPDFLNSVRSQIHSGRQIPELCDWGSWRKGEYWADPSRNTWLKPWAEELPTPDRAVHCIWRWAHHTDSEVLGLSQGTGLLSLVPRASLFSSEQHVHGFVQQTGLTPSPQCGCKGLMRQCVCDHWAMWM